MANEADDITNNEALILIEHHAEQLAATARDARKYRQPKSHLFAYFDRLQYLHASYNHWRNQEKIDG